MKESAEMRRERVVRELTELENALLAAQAKIPGLVRNVRGMRALASGEEVSDDDTAPESGSGSAGDGEPAT